MSLITVSLLIVSYKKEKVDVVRNLLIKKLFLSLF